MINSGVYTLMADEIKTAVTGAEYTPIIGLDGITGATLVARFGYGSGGTSVAAKVQTSLDGADTWQDVAFFSFTTASAIKVANLSGLTPVDVEAYADLSADGVNDAILGDRLRVVVTSVGTYAGSTTLSIRLAAR